MKPTWTAGLMSLLVWTSCQAADTARSFIISAIEADNTDVKLGLLAEARGSTKAVKELGRKLKLDHFESRRGAFRLAHRLHVHLPEGADRRERREYSRLVTLRGGAFDREYVRYVVAAEQRQLQRAEAMKQAPGLASQLANRDLSLLQTELSSATTVQTGLPSHG